MNEFELAKVKMKRMNLEKCSCFMLVNPVDKEGIFSKYVYAGL